MSFLAPLFLLGAAAITLPIVFHLIRRSSRERIPFSSLMFLMPTPPRVTRRSKLENLLLLLLRCAVVFLLAIAFARPFFSQPVAPDPTARRGEKILVLIDVSASMRRAGLWDEAIAKAEAIVSSSSSAEQLACYTFDRDLRAVLTFEDWSTMGPAERIAFSSKRLEGVKPGWGPTRIGNALLTACEMFDSKGADDQMVQRIVLISDLQEGSRLDGLQGFEWPRGVQVQIEQLKAKLTSNAGLQLAPEREEAPAGTAAIGPRVRVSNSSDSKREQFQIGWRGKGQTTPAGPTLDVYVPPGQSRIVSAPAPAEAGQDTLMVTGDDEPFDNAVSVLPPRIDRAKLVYLGDERETDAGQSLYYLRRAFQNTKTFAVDVQGRNPNLVLSDKEMAGLGLVIVGAALPEEQVAAMRRFAEQGKAVLVVLNDLSIGPTVRRLLGVDNLEVAEAKDGGYAMLGQIDFGHALFAPFADPRYSDFTKIHFWKHRTLGLEGAKGARVLARFDNGDQALVEVPLGKGRIWVLAAGWRPEDSQLALSSKFVPLLYAMLEQSSVAGLEQRSQYAIGDAVTLPESITPVTIRKPDASEVQLASGEPFTGTDQPGVYTVTSSQPPMNFAVNLAPEESRTAPLPLEELERLGLPLQPSAQPSAHELQRRKEHLHATQLENRQKLWRWLIVGALMVLVVETWLAGRVTRRPLTVSAEMPS